MTTFFDTSAVVALHVEAAERRVAAAALDEATCVSALALTEALAVIDTAASLLRDQPVRLADAVQLAAAVRLPRPVRYVTFDPIQIPVALGLGLDVVST